MSKKGNSKLLEFLRFSRSDQKPDHLFVLMFVGLIIFGLLMLASSSGFASFQNYGNSYYYLTHQILYGFIPGFVALYIFSRLDYHVWKKIALFLFILSFILLIAVFLPGIGHGYQGANRWINLGFLKFQPTEMVKLFFVIYLATWLSGKDMSELKRFSTGFLSFLIIFGLIAFPIIKQPDIGTLGVFTFIAFTMFFAAQASWKHIVLSIFGGAGFLVLLIKTASYRMDRLMVFLHPELDPQGKGYQIKQALLAIGSGGFFGRGFGHARQKFGYLPENYGDSIFAVIGEELGFFSILVVILYASIAIRGYKIAEQAPDKFGKLLAVGISTWIISQAFINIGANLAVLPLTGIPLPFISYGGTSLVISMSAIGILINISRQKVKS